MYNIFYECNVCVISRDQPLWFISPSFLYVSWANQLSPRWHNTSRALDPREHQNMGRTAGHKLHQVFKASLKPPSHTHVHTDGLTNTYRSLESDLRFPR